MGLLASPILAALLAVGSAIGIAHAQGAGARGEPRLDFPVYPTPITADLGFIQARSTVKQVFILHNTLDRPVRIIQAEPSCTCTTTDIKGKVIPPLGTLEMPVEMKVSGSTGIKQAGVQLVFEGIKGAIGVSMQGEVVYPVRATSVDAKGAVQPFIDAHTDPSRVKGVIQVSSVDGKPFRVLSVHGAAPEILGRDPSMPPASTYSVRYDLSGIPCEAMPKYLLIETDRPDARVIDMRIRHECTQIHPKIPFGEFRSNAGAVKGGESVEVDVLMKKMGAARVAKVTSKDPRVGVELLRQVADGDGVLATLAITPQAGAKGVIMFPVTFEVPSPKGILQDDYLVYLVVE